MSPRQLMGATWLQSSSSDDKSNKKDKRISAFPIRKDMFEDAEYSNHLTPLVLASQLERTDMVRLLLRQEQGEVNPIHPVSSKCLFFIVFFLLQLYF